MDAETVPDENNFYCTLDTTIPVNRIAELYCSNGWQIRKCGWAEFEITSSYAELIVETASPILMHGSIVDVATRVDEILAPLEKKGIVYFAECYDQEGTMIRKCSNT